MIGSESDGAEDQGFGCGVLSQRFQRSAPTEIIGEVLGGDTVEAQELFFQPAMIGVDVVDVKIWRVWFWLTWHWQDVRRNACLAREGNNRGVTVATEFVGGSYDTFQCRCDGQAVQFRQHGIGGGAMPATRDKHGNLFSGDPHLAGLPPLLRAARGIADRLPLNDSRMNVSSPSTIPDKAWGLSVARASRNLCRHLKAVV